MSAHPNRVRELRGASGLTQAALAATVELTRQSLHAIEAGKAVPAVDVALRLARALHCGVEELFGESASEPRFSTEPVGPALAGRVSLAHIGGRWLSYSLGLLGRDGMARSADAIASRAARGRLEVEVLRPVAEARENVVLMGCAPALGLLADRLNASPGPGKFSWLARSSTSALESLAQRHTHLAGVHLVDAKTGEANVPDVRRLAAERALVMVTLASWDAGLVTLLGNPKSICKVAHLGRKGVRLAAREAGSGARRLLDRELQRAGLPAEIAGGASLVLPGHVEVAQAVALGAADVGIATRDAALAFGLGFVPIAEERYDLVVARDDLNDPRLARLFETMSRGPFRRELGALGYDLGQCGTRVAEILAA